ncbi:hypothetical protein PV326_008085, partial [Microctonus aethiopoides]
ANSLWTHEDPPSFPAHVLRRVYVLVNFQANRDGERQQQGSLYRLDNMASLYTSLLLLCFDGVHKTSFFKRKPNAVAKHQVFLPSLENLC